MSVTRDVEQATVQAQTKVNIKNLHDQQRINAENLEETLRVQREEAQRAPAHGHRDRQHRRLPAREAG